MFGAGLQNSFVQSLSVDQKRFGVLISFYLYYSYLLRILSILFYYRLITRKVLEVFFCSSGQHVQFFQLLRYYVFLRIK